MPYILPLLAIGWGVSKIIKKDDSADIAFKNFMLKIPQWVKDNVKSIEQKNDNIVVNFKDTITEENKEATIKELQQRLKELQNK